MISSYAWPVVCYVVVGENIHRSRWRISILWFHLPVDFTNNVIVQFHGIPCWAFPDKSLHSQERVQELQFLVSKPEVTNSSNMICASSSEFAVTHPIQLLTDSSSLLLTRTLLLRRHDKKLWVTLQKGWSESLQWMEETLSNNLDCLVNNDPIVIDNLWQRLCETVFCYL